MKSINLTKDHKSKLLEMCDKLFPEYLLIDVHKNGLLVLWEELPPSRKWNEIHWFEFCTITLWNELYLKLGTLELKSYYELLLNNLLHPVDYLYEHFKKLK